MAIAPGVDADEAFAAQLLADLSDPGRGVLPADRGTVEARFGAAFRGLLDRSGWVADEPWTPLRRDLTAAVEECGLRIEVLDADHVDDRVLQDRVEVGRASFPSSTFTLERWRAMAGSSAYRRARCLVAYDDEGIAVAATTVWSAGRGRAIVVAAAAALQQLGSSSATVCTPSSNVGGVAAYQSGGFERLPAVTDFRRPS